MIKNSLAPSTRNLSITSYFHSYVDSINPSEPEIKDITESESSVLYLDILLQKGINGNLTTKLCAKQGDFNISIVIFHFLCTCSNIS